jgi:enoyl-CoA hydratase/carnithine racemase
VGQPNGDASRLQAEGGASVLLSQDGPVLTVTLNRPAKKNAIDWPTWEQLRSTFRDIGTRTDIRVVVLTGAPGAFCSGNDLASTPPDVHPILQMEIVNDVALALHRLSKVTVARVDGVAVGAGCNLALACDMVIASDRSRFAEIFVRRGLSVDFGASWILPRIIGLHRAKELCLTGDFLDAEEAARIGLVNRCVPVADLDLAVGELVGRLLEGAPMAQVLVKRLLNHGSLSTMEQALDSEASAQVVNVGSGDFAEATAAFLGRRDPVFDGSWAAHRGGEAAAPG